MIIVCASHATAGQVIMLLVLAGHSPTTDFRMDRAGSSESPVGIRVTRSLSAEDAARLRDAVGTVPGASIQ